MVSVVTGQYQHGGVTCKTSDRDAHGRCIWTVYGFVFQGGVANVHRGPRYADDELTWDVGSTPRSSPRPGEGTNSDSEEAAAEDDFVEESDEEAPASKRLRFKRVRPGTRRPCSNC